MLKVFKSLELSNVFVRDIDVYGSIVPLSKRLSLEFVRKSLAKCFVHIRKHAKDECIYNWYFYKDDVTHWLGYLLHRDNDQPAVIYSCGQYWYQHGKGYRSIDQPAITYINGLQKWYQRGKLHRDNDQPAIIYPDGGQEFWKNGKRYL